MTETTLNANIKLQKDMYKSNLDEFNKTIDKELLRYKYKKQMRFDVIIIRNLAKENNDIAYFDFLNTIIEEMTNEIVLLNKSFKDGSINNVLNNFSFHEKVNIIFYVRPVFYDKKFEPYEILNKDTFEVLKSVIISDANTILKQYNINLKDVRKININIIKKIINNDELYEDIMYASELVK